MKFAFVLPCLPKRTVALRLDARRLLEEAWTHKKQFPKTLFLADGQFTTTFPAEAMRQNISVECVPESQLMTFIGEARQGFKEYRDAKR